MIFFRIAFKDGLEDRQLSVFMGKYALNDYKIDGVLLSLSFWGNSVNILKKMCEYFGGYIDENDCDDKDFYPINLHEFEKGIDYSEYDLFTQKVIKELGYENLEKAINLFAEFKNLNQWHTRSEN